MGVGGWQCWGVDSINAPDLQEIKTHRLAKESGQLDSLSISDNGRYVDWTERDGYRPKGTRSGRGVGREEGGGRGGGRAEKGGGSGEGGGERGERMRGAGGGGRG